MTERFYLNDGWRFTECFSDNLLKSNIADDTMEEVRIPHTVKETPFNYFDESIYQMVSGYQKAIFVPSEWEGKNLLLTFDGVAHDATVYVNGIAVNRHLNGYTAFTTDITSKVHYGKENLITVRVDSFENLNQPPFGYVIDYMTYGGIYRDVYLEVVESTYIEDVFVYSNVTGDEAVLSSEVKICGDYSNAYVEMSLNDKYLTKFELASNKAVVSSNVGKIKLWDIDNPNLYDVEIKLYKDNVLLDQKIVKHGFRTSEFKADGYYLNGKRLKLRGLNRHQSFPYVGYAMPDSMQILDAHILKEELGVNAVRTSHYPQSQAFIDECDKIGLLVFTEIPGWQHIGNAEWKEKAINNVSEMVLQYRNHPSIILWGVRINESVDDDAFYLRTNETAHKLDPTRPTGGVRANKKSSLLEDVYTYNDFVHDGTTKGCEPKKNVTSNINKPYLVSEYNGHMYSTKSFDWEEHRREHAIRHANVLNAVAGEGDIAGSFGWCMFDYNTHKDFGSGDRICYHGVMDMFRNPKMASHIYAAEGSKDVVLELSSTMDIGEHPGCNRGATWIFTNADSVKTYKNDRFLKEYTAKDSAYNNLSHGPIQINDFVGNAIDENEGFSKGKAKAVKEALNLTALNGLSHLPKRALWLGAKCIAFYHMGMNDAVSLYNKYIGDWGGESTVYKFEAIKDGQVVKTLVKSPSTSLHLAVSVDHLSLIEGKSYDVSAVRIRVVDENGNQVSFFNEPVSFETEGSIELIGENVIGLKGGMAGTYVKSIGIEGTGTLIIKNSQCETVRVQFTVDSANVKKI